MLDDGTRKYTPGVSSRNGSTSTFQHSGLKNATEQSNSSQSVTATKKYDAFGNVASSSGTWQGPFGYAGNYGYQEDANGLKLLGHRYYDSGTGRFLTSDPIGDGSNWYAYCGNNPVSGFDATGEIRTDLAQGAVILAEEEAGQSMAAAWLSRIPNWIKWLANLGCKNHVVVTRATGATAAAVGAARSANMPNLARMAGETAMSYGNRAHAAFSAAAREAGRMGNQVISGTRLRPDDMDVANRFIRELKPNNARAISFGNNQLSRYLAEAEKAYGGTWRGEVVTYDMPPFIKVGLPRSGSRSGSGFLGGSGHGP